ncbi:ISAs1 family transposase, partial [Deinococcus marmoris]|uniref:ISAs1 family transposase n=4 Tax=Deinococcus marmoris TaxID=249408 RepID=UPI0039EDF229
MSSKIIRQADLITLTATFATLDDPRQARGIRHLLCDILVISVLAVICGATNYALIHTFAVHRQVWLRRFLRLQGGIPSQDTFERIFGIVAPDTFRAVFCGWIQQIPSQALPEGEREVFAIDGKTSRGTASDAFAALHTVSVYSVQCQLVLEAVTVPVKANEITVLPALIQAVAPVGGIVTIDAMGCQKNVAAIIRTFPGT